MELVIRKTDKTWITNSFMICNNKLHKQKENFLFSDSKSYQLILKFCENVFFRILTVNFNLSDRFTNIDWHYLTLCPEEVFRYI